MDAQEFTPQQYRKLNGQSIMLALQNMGGSATADDLADHIGALIDQPQHIVKQEVRLVLRRGISNGFFQRRGKNYFLFSQGNTYQLDGRRKRKANFAVPMQTDGGSSKKFRNSSQNDDDDDSVTKLEINEQSIQGLQKIIAKANEETQRATILATKAVKQAKLASTKIQKIVGNDDSLLDE